jgi:hypothetical protein
MAGRDQQVKVGDKLSTKRSVEVGVPQDLCLVKVGDKLSTKRSVEVGVPQGSVLGQSW